MRQVRALLVRPSGGDDPMQLARRALVSSHSQLSGFDLVLVPRQPQRPEETLTSSFYERQHHDIHYRRNNWLLDQLPVLKAISPRTVVEVGSGNGRFIRAVAPYVEHVIGIDWARSPELVDLPHNVDILQSDVVTAPIPSADLICSADVLEHLAPRVVDPVIAKLVAAGPYQHHVIACYDDGHSHLSILPPAAWLSLFLKHCPTAYLADVHYRRQDPMQIVCIVSNLPRS